MIRSIGDACAAVRVATLAASCFISAACLSDAFAEACIASKTNTDIASGAAVDAAYATLAVRTVSSSDLIPCCKI
jgi:hypothetical protein